MSRNTFFLDAIIVESGIIQNGALNPRNVGNVIVHFFLKTQPNFLRFALLMVPSQLLRN